MKIQNRLRPEYPCMKFEYPGMGSFVLSELDRYLAMGWFRMRQSVFTCDILLKEYSVHNTVWIRTPLNGYNYTKSLRKLMRRNDKIFININAIFYIAEMEELYQRYRAYFKGDLSESLHLSFYGEDYILDHLVKQMMTENIIIFLILGCGKFETPKITTNWWPLVFLTREQIAFKVSKVFMIMIIQSIV